MRRLWADSQARWQLVQRVTGQKPGMDPHALVTACFMAVLVIAIVLIWVYV